MDKEYFYVDGNGDRHELSDIKDCPCCCHKGFKEGTRKDGKRICINATDIIETQAGS